MIQPRMRSPLRGVAAALALALAVAPVVRPRGRAARAAQEQPVLPGLPGEGHDPRRLRRALRGGREPGLRLPEVPGDAGSGRPQPDPPVRGHLLREAGRLRHRRQHARPGSGAGARPVGAQRHAGSGRRGREVRPVALGPRLLRAAALLRGRGREARRRGRGGPLLLLLRVGLAVRAAPRGEQRERRRRASRRRRPRPSTTATSSRSRRRSSGRSSRSCATSTTSTTRSRTSRGPTTREPRTS